MAGIYLAVKLHQWHSFYVQWGIIATIVIASLEGRFTIPNEGKFAELAQRDIERAGAGEVTLSAEYETLARRVGLIGA